MCPAYMSKHNSKREKPVVIFMIWNGEGQYYPAVKKLCELLIGITSKNNDDFYYLNCFHSCRTNNKLE